MWNYQTCHESRVRSIANVDNNLMHWFSFSCYISYSINSVIERNNSSTITKSYHKVFIYVFLNLFFFYILILQYIQLFVFKVF